MKNLEVTEPVSFAGADLVIDQPIDLSWEPNNKDFKVYDIRQIQEARSGEILYEYKLINIHADGEVKGHTTDWIAREKLVVQKREAQKPTRRLAVSKRIDEAELEAHQEGLSLRDWMNKYGYEFNAGNTFVDRYVLTSGIVELPKDIWTNTHPDEDYLVFYQSEFVRFEFREKDVLLTALDNRDDSRWWTLSHHTFEATLRAYAQNEGDGKNMEKTALELVMLKMWKQGGMVELYRYKHRIMGFYDEERTHFELFYDMTQGHYFQDLVDLASLPHDAMVEDVKVSIEMLLDTRMKGAQV